MNPFHLSLTPLRKAVDWVGSGSMPMMARGLYRQELTSWSLLAVMMGAVEGAVAGMIVKNAYDGVVGDVLLNQAVALVTGAPQLGNIASFLWAGLSHGRDKIRFLFAVQIATVIAVLLIGLAPISGLGLAMLVTGVLGARVCWSGIVTVRATVWRANYSRDMRANMAGRVATVFAVLMACSGMVIGLAMNHFDRAFHVLYPVAAVFGLGGALTYRNLKVRRHGSLLRAERDEHAGRAGMSLGVIYRVLRHDRAFRRYMLCMAVFGSGNMMMLAPLLVVLNDHLGFSRLGQVMVTSSIPLLVIPAAIPLWARLLDRAHVIPYRARQSWSFVVALFTLATGAVSAYEPLLWLGALALGVAFAGGQLGWNLGHHDFAPEGLASHYMGVHVTLTGVRGLITPVVGVGLYQLVEAWRPGMGPWTLYAPLLLSVTGAVGFVRMSRRGRWLRW